MITLCRCGLPNTSFCSERTIRRWIETGKLPATKHGAHFQIALADLDPFLDSRPPDLKELLARITALETHSAEQKALNAQIEVTHHSGNSQ